MVESYWFVSIGLVVAGFVLGYFGYRRKVKDTSFRCPWCNNWHFVYPTKKDPDSDFTNDMIDRAERYDDRRSGV